MKETLDHPLNPAQYQAATHGEGPVLVLAGAGAGKTKIVTSRIAHLISNGIPPRAICAVTFTNKAAAEMKERVEGALSGEKTKDLVVSTFHSLAVKILRNSIAALDYHTQFAIYDEEDASKVLKGCLKTLDIPFEAGKIKSFKSMISLVKNQLLEEEALPCEELLSSQQKGIELYRLYQRRLKEANALDFDDLLYLTVRLFKEHKNILEDYQARWHYLLIDEYQDTNPAQYQIARYLVEKSGNIFAVGDPDQSIYSWRGANIQNILRFEKDYPGATLIKLEQNYRSSNNILEGANDLIAHNVSRYEKNLWSTKGAGEKIKLFVAYDEREEGWFVIDEILRLHQEKKMPFNGMAIFYRTNFQSRTFEDCLLRHRIPYTIVGGVSFYQRKEIKDVLALLRMIVSDSDYISFARSLQLIKKGFGDTTLEKLQGGASQSALPLLEYCRKVCKEELPLKLSLKQKEELKSYLELVSSLRLLQNELPLHEIIALTIQKAGIFDILKQDSETFADRKANVEELVAKAMEWEGEATTLSSFLEDITLKGSVDDAHFEEDRVYLMTIHNSKGLEFSTVFLVGMEEDLFPHVNSKDLPDKVEEERRLAYVGMTRAKEILYLTAAESRFLWGGLRRMRPSRFLREIPKEYIEKII